MCRPILSMLLFSTVLAAQAVDPLLVKGDEAAAKGDFRSAEKCYKDAEKASGKRCPECNIRLADLYLRAGERSFAVDFAKKAISQSDDETTKLGATIHLGQIQMTIGKEDPPMMKAAEETFRKGLIASPNAPRAMLYLAEAMMWNGRKQQSTEALRELIKKFPRTPEADTAQAWLDEPKRMRFETSPTFTIKVNGEDLSLASLRGKTVVLDFWGTWCPPCVASVGELKELTRKYPRERFELISVNVNDKKEKWSQFISAKKMDWPQYRDEEDELTKLFGVNAFPTYIIIDPEGYITDRIVGFEPTQSVAYRLKDALARSVGSTK